MKKGLGTQLKSIQKVDTENYRLKLKFTDGFTGDLSLGQIFNEPKGLVAEVLRGDMFSRCFIESGALAWPNGLEFCPDALRKWIKEQQDVDAA